MNSRDIQERFYKCISVQSSGLYPGWQAGRHGEDLVLAAGGNNKGIPYLIQRFKNLYFKDSFLGDSQSLTFKIRKNRYLKTC